MKFIADPLDPSNVFSSTDGAEFYAGFYAAAGNHVGIPSAEAPPVILPTSVPTFLAETVVSQSAQQAPGGPGSVVAETSGGITINLLFDAAAMAAPASFRAGIEQAASILSATITDQITVNLNIDYSGTGGGAKAGPDNGQYVSYSTVRADLIGGAAPGDTTFNALPSGSTFQGQSYVAVWNAQLKVMGLLSANANTDDGSAYFNTDINSNLLVGVALHELTHALGRVPYGPVPGDPTAEGPEPDIFDFFRFTSPGTRLIEGSSTAPAAYFSIDGGNTKLADFGQTSDASDFLNSGVQGPNDPFNEFYTGSTSQSLSAVDKEILDALGFHVAAPKPDLSEYVAVNKTTVAPGGSITIDAYDMNLGNGVSGPSTAGIYLSTDPTITTSDTLLATVVSSGTLATVSQPGYYDHQTVSVTLPGNLAPGTYYIGGIADYNNQVAESNETNNTYNVVQITVAAPQQPSATQYVGAMLELAGASSDSVTFTGSSGVLSLDAPSKFGGQIGGISGNGTLAASDQSDLHGLSFSAIHSNYNSSTGAHDVSDGTATADIKFVGTYSQANFKFADDGGGTSAHDSPTSGQPISPDRAAGDAASQVVASSHVNLAALTSQDSFVFSPNSGQAAISSYKPATDIVQISQSPFASMTAVLAATHNDPHGNAAVLDAAHDMITIQNISAAQLLAHQSDFHLA
jgi:hypothetical protein